MKKRKPIKWSFKEYEKHSLSKRWYLMATIIGAVILVYSVLTNNYLFALLTIMFGIILVIKQHQDPIDIEFEINKNGIKLGKNEYKYRNIEEFWIVYDPPTTKNIYFSFKSSLKPRLSIPLEDLDPIEIKTFLREYIEENIDEETEPASESLGRLLKL